MRHPGSRTAEGFAYELQQEKDSWLGQVSLSQVPKSWPVKVKINKSREAMRLKMVGSGPGRRK